MSASVTVATPGTSRPDRGIALLQPFLESLVALALAVVAGSLVLLLAGHHPIDAWRELLARTLGRPIGLQEVLVRATPLLVAGMAVLLAAKAGLWNIGIDGQVMAGALAAAVAGHALEGSGRAAIWIGALAAAAIAGAGWIAIPALLRARWNINEIVTTIMFNYVALSLTAWLVRGPIRDESLVTPQTSLIPRDLRFATIGDTRVHVGLGLTIIVWGCLAFWLQRTEAGFELRAVGESPRAARHAMIPVSRVIVGAMLASGAIAAIAGANDVLSTKGTFQAEWNPEYGLAAFALVFLARRNVFALLPAALLMGILSYGADVMPRAAGVPSAFFTLFEGFLLLALAIIRWQPWAQRRHTP